MNNFFKLRAMNINSSSLKIKYCGPSPNTGHQNTVEDEKNVVIEQA